jgi:hypothetical protein
VEIPIHETKAGKNNFGVIKAMKYWCKAGKRPKGQIT